MIPTTQEVKNGYLQRGGKPEHFYKWLRRVRAEAEADFANLCLDTPEREMALAFVKEELT